MSDNVSRTSDDFEQSATDLGQSAKQARNINRRLQDLLNRRAEASGNPRVRMPDNGEGDRLTPSSENRASDAGSSDGVPENQMVDGGGDRLAPDASGGAGGNVQRGDGTSMDAPKSGDKSSATKVPSGSADGAGAASEAMPSSSGVSTGSGASASAASGEAAASGMEAGSGGGAAVGEAAGGAAVSGGAAAGGETAAAGTAASGPVGWIIIAICIVVIILFILVCGAIIQVLGDPMIEKQYDEGYEIEQEYGSEENDE